jgi:hypothetical protein
MHKNELEKFNKHKQQQGYCKGNFREWDNTRKNARRLLTYEAECCE